MQYGFDVLPEMPIDYEKVVVPSAIDLRKVAEWTGQTIDEIQALNPELRRWTTPVASSNYEIKVPAGTADAFTRRLAAASPDELASLKWYTVRSGESIATIARKLHVSRSDLAEANQLSIRSRLKIGQELVIPRAPTALLASNTAPPPPATVASRAISGTTGVVPATRREAPATVMYRVKRGDTLSSIARLYDTTVAKLKSWNALTGSHIAPGDRLKIIGARTR
jgi:membrane-bound lytic murein transglycosylase D